MSARRQVYGVGPVRELLRAGGGDVHVIYVAVSRTASGKRRAGSDPHEELVREAKARGIAIEPRDRRELDALTPHDARHQGVVAIAGELAYADAFEVLDSVRAAGDTPLVVCLDGVQDPHNLGAIVRSSYVLGAHLLIIPERRAATVTAVVTKASAGATEHLPIACVTNLARTLADLKQAGLWLAAVAAGDNAQPLWTLEGKSPLALVLGAEGRGLRPLIAKSCDFAVEIPMPHAAVGSLNVSVAAGIVLYEVARQRRHDA